MKRNLQAFGRMAIIWIGLMGYVLSAYSQQRAPAVPGQPAGAARGAPQGGQRGQALPGTETGWSTFQQRCAVCHLNPTVDLATPGTVLRQMTPEKIYESLTTGSMKEKSEGINDGTKRRIAEFLSGRPMGSSA